MPSTCSSMRRRRSRAAGRHGARAKPQLPITTVVTPCQQDGVHETVPRDLCVVVRVDVDESRRDDQSADVDDAPRRAVEPSDRDDAPVRDREIAGCRRRAAAVADRPAAQDHVGAHAEHIAKISAGDDPWRAPRRRRRGGAVGETDQSIACSACKNRPGKSYFHAAGRRTAGLPALARLSWPGTAVAAPEGNAWRA